MTTGWMPVALLLSLATAVMTVKHGALTALVVFGGSKIHSGSEVGTDGSATVAELNFVAGGFGLSR